MSQNNFMFEWKKYDAYYDVKEDGSYIIHDDAPEIVKKSYHEYQKLFMKMEQFPKRKTSFGFASLFKESKKHPVEKTKIINTSYEITPVFDMKSKREIIAQFTKLSDKHLQKCLELPFWCSRDSNKVNGYICIDKSGDAGLEIVMFDGCEEALSTLYQEVKKWGVSQKLSYCFMKVDPKNPKIALLDKLQFKMIDLYEVNNECVHVYMRNL